MILDTQMTSPNHIFSEFQSFSSFPCDFTMDQWFQIWLNDYKINNVKPTTRQIYEDLYKCQIKQPLGSLPISQIRSLHIQRMYNQFMSKGLSSKYLHNVNAVLYNLFDVAVRNDLIAKNPCDGVIKPPIDAIERRVLTSQEQIRFLRFIRQNRWSFYEPTLTVLLGTGLRVGELLALNWEDINFEQKTISVTKTLVYVKDRNTKKFHFAIQTPKTKHGKRIIPLQRDVALALRRQQKNQAEIHAQGKWSPHPGFERLVFTGRTGQPQQRGAVQGMLNKIVKAINTEEKRLAEKEGREPVLMDHLHPHALRHSFATRCFEVDMPIKTVQTLLGHASIQMTMDLYTHVSEQKMLEDMQKLDQVFSSV